MATRTDPVLDIAIPLMRDFIIQTWWETRLPVRASDGDRGVRVRGYLKGTSNPSGWWSRAWTAMEVIGRGESTVDQWLAERYAEYFRGLSRQSNKRPYLYFVEDTKICSRILSGIEGEILSRTDGQGLIVGVEERRAIEEAGMHAARSWLHSRGFSEDQITDTSATQPWDLEARRGSDSLYVEAKGCCAPWSNQSTVFVTANEVEHARAHPNSCALVIAAGCQLTRQRDGKIVATAAEQWVCFPWKPSKLHPVLYKCEPENLTPIVR